MKKIFILAFGLVSLVSTAQKTIVNEKFEKDNVPLGYNFLQKSNKLVIQKGKHVGVSTNREVHSLNSYDSNGSNEVLLKDAIVMNVGFSTMDNSFLATQYAAMKWDSDFKVYNENKVSSLINKDERTFHFNKDYFYSIVNAKGKNDIDMYKEDVFLQKYSINDKKTIKTKIEKPSINSINKEEYYKLKEINYKLFFKKDCFEFVTKFIKKDCKTATMYRTMYDYNGKIISTKQYEIALDNPFIQTNNGGGNLKYISSGNMTVPRFEDQLSINNFIEDEATKEIYVYGIYGAKGKESLTSNPAGYYVIKYDASGKLIWKQFKDITEKDFNSYKYTMYLTVIPNLTSTTFDLYFHSDYVDEFVIYKQLSRTNGDQLKSNNLTFKEDKVYTFANGTRDFILSFYEIGKNKIRHDTQSMIFYDSNKAFKNYINSISSSKSKIYLNTLSSKEGIWLIESDNETYYKVTYFNHE